VETFALQQSDCIEGKMHWSIVTLNDKIVINDAFMRNII